MSAVSPVRNGPRALVSGVRGRVAQVAIAVAAAGIAVEYGLITGEAPFVGIALGVVVVLVAAILTKPDAATLVVVALIYSNAAVVGVKLHGLPFVLGAAVPLLLVAPLAYLLIVRRQPLVIGPALPWMIAFFCVIVFGAVLSRDPADASHTITAYVIEGLGLYVLLTNVIRTEELLRQVIWVLIAVGALLGLLSVFQQLTGSFGNDYFGFGQVYGGAFGTGTDEFGREIVQRRLAGPIGDANRYGQIMLVLIPIAFVRMWAEPKRWLRFLAGGATLLITAGSMLTFSRGGAVAIACLVVLMAVLRYIRFYQLVVVGVATVVLFTVVPGYSERLSSLGAIGGVAGQGDERADSSVRSRATEYLVALLMFRDHPVIGIGPGLYAPNYPEYARQTTEYSNLIDISIKNNPREPHNLYLGMAAETGVLGLAFFLGAVVATMRRLIRGRRLWLEERPELAQTLTGFILALVAYLVSGLFLHLSYERYYFILLALAGVACVIAANKAAEKPPADPEPAEAISR